MVTAAPAFLEEVKEAWVRTEVRRELHERFDLWLDSVGKVVKEESPSLEALSRVVDKSNRRVQGKLDAAGPPLSLTTLSCRSISSVPQTGGMEQGKKTVISVLREALH